MKTTGIFVARDEIKEQLCAEWANCNYWQKRYIIACNEQNTTDTHANEPGISVAATAKARAIRAEYRARGIETALCAWAGITVHTNRDYDTPREAENYHPVVSLKIEWSPNDVEEVAITA